MNWPDLTVNLADIPWAVVGAVATRQYMPERSTADLDIAILPSDTGRVAERLRAAGYELLGSLSIGGSTWRSPAGIALDVLECRES